MRAPYNTTCTVYDGPGTATPNFPRVVGLECRLVSDPLFRDQAEPLRQSVTYLTCPSGQLRGAPTTDLGGGDWKYEYAKADRVEVALLPGVTWVVARVETCTGPEQPAYDRGSLILVEAPPPDPCSDTYAPQYHTEYSEESMPPRVFRDSATQWSTEGVILLAETDGTPGEGCVSIWRCEWDGMDYWAPYNGTGFVNLLRGGVGPEYIQVYDLR